MGQEHPVDAARAGAGNNVGDDAQAKLRLFERRGENVLIDGLAGAVRGVRVISGSEIPARPGEMPNLLGDAMHVDGKTDAAIADQRQPQFLLSHDGKMARRGALVDGNDVRF